jgi:hypothetical protein
MVRTGTGRFIGAGVVGLLALVVILLEAAPIALYQAAGTLWFLNDPELAAWTFWMPLKSGLHDSFLYVYAGFGFWASLRIVHAITAAVLHSTEATLEYMQLYSVLTQLFLLAINAVLVLGIVATRQLSRSAKIAALAFMAFLVIGTAQLFWMYSARETMEGAIKPLATLGFVLILLELERVFGNNKLRSLWFALAAGAFFGAAFFQMSIYTYLAVFFLVVAALHRTIGEFLRYVAVFVFGGLIGGIVELVWFYQGDLDSSAAAFVSQFIDIIAGVPLAQPDFDQEYWGKFLSLESRYLVDQIIQIGALGVCLVTLLVCVLALLRRRKALVTTILLPVSVVYLFVVLVHFKIFQTHGGYSTEFSLTIASGLYLALSLYVVARAGAFRTHWHLLGWQVATIVAVVCLSGAYSLDMLDVRKGYHYRLSQSYFETKLNADGALASVVRQYDQTLNALAAHYTVVNNDELYWSNNLVAWQDYPAEQFYHHGTISGPNDLRYGTQLEQTRHPRYTVFTPEAVIGVSESCTAVDPAVIASQSAGRGYCAPLFNQTPRWQINVVADRQPASPTGAWIVPVASDFSTPEVRMRAENLGRTAASRATLRPAEDAVAFAADLSGSSRSEGLISDTALTGAQLTASPYGPNGSQLKLGWTIVPVTNDEALSMQTPVVKVLLADGYRPYLSVLSGMEIAYQLILFPPS